MPIRRRIATAAAAAVATAALANARSFDGYSLNDANVAAQAIDASDLYILATVNAKCELDVTSLEECAAGIALSLNGVLVPENINSQHYPAGCFVATDPVTFEQGAFFNFHASAVNTEDLSHESLCRTGATIGDVATASWCKTTSTAATADDVDTESGCAAACAADNACKGIAFDRGTSKCTFMGTETYSLVYNVSAGLHCVRMPSCVRSDSAVAVEIVDLSTCLMNPRLSQVLAEQEACFEAGCAELETFDAEASVVQCEGSWSNYSECSRSCNTGRQFQTFQVTTPASNGGADCPSQHGDVAPRRCYLMTCPVDCEGDWSAWTACAVSCGGGSQSRTFVVAVDDVAGGVTCDFAADHQQKRDCSTPACPTTTTTPRATTVSPAAPSMGGPTPGTAAPHTDPTTEGGKNGLTTAHVLITRDTSGVGGGATLAPATADVPTDEGDGGARLAPTTVGVA